MSQTGQKVNGSSKPPRPNAYRKPKFGHVSILPIISICPSPENEEIYGPVRPTDLDVIALAQSIRQDGIKEPLIITQDNYILSGHRRYAAARLAGLSNVPCRKEQITRSDERYMELLTVYNRQRVKTADQVFREELVALNPEESYRLLVEHRTEQSSITADTIHLGDRRGRAKISDAKLPFLNAIIKVLNDRRNYWPLTDRQIHYALLNNPPLIHASKPASIYRNNVVSYKATCELVTRARLEETIPWNAIDDPTRQTVIWTGHRSIGSFVRRQLDGFLKGYYRDLLQSQPNQIEIVAEKNTINNIVRPVASEYCIPMTTGRGYCSLPPRKKMAERFRQSGKTWLILLVLSDFDPEGEDIASSYARSMRDDFGIEEIKPIKVLLTASQVKEMELPPQMQAKKTSSRYQKFADEHGDSVFEMEAVSPDDTQQILRDVIDSVLDVDAFNAEVEAEKQDAAHLEAKRKAIKKLIGNLADDDQEVCP